MGLVERINGWVSWRASPIKGTHRFRNDNPVRQPTNWMRSLAVCLAALVSPMPAVCGDFFTLKGHGGPIMGIAVAPGGQIATASFDNAVGVWDGLVPTWFDGHEAAVNAVLFVDTVLYSAGDDFTIRRWPGGDVIGRHNGKVVALTALMGVIASASWDGTIGLWPLDGRAAHILKGHTSNVNAVVFSNDGKWLFSASSDGTIRQWDAVIGNPERVILRHGFGINELLLNHTRGWLAYGTVDGATRIIDVETGDQIADFTLDRRPILALAQSRDGHYLAVGDGEGYIMIIDTRNWRIARDFRATTNGPVWALAMSSDGQNIHAGGLDNAMYSWPIATLAEHGKMADTNTGFLRDPALMDNGERQFMRKCSICHAVTAGSARRAGPSLFGVFGRAAGSVADYSYSNTLDRSSIIWDEDSINALFDLGPDHYIPGTKMPMQRITDANDRADLIAYLRRASAKHE